MPNDGEVSQDGVFALRNVVDRYRDQEDDDESDQPQPPKHGLIVCAARRDA